MDADIFKTSLGPLKKIKTSYSQTTHLHNIWKKTSDLQRLDGIRFTSSWRSVIYFVLKTLICDVLNTSDSSHHEDVCIKQHLFSKVVPKSTQRRKKWFFLVLYCLKYSEKCKCFCLGWYLGMKLCKLLRFSSHTS